MPADLFVSLHCNAAGGDAQGTETLVLSESCEDACKVAQTVQNQIVNSLGTVDRGLKERPKLIVLKHTDAPAILVEMAFIDNDSDSELLANNQDDFAKAIARGITDAGY
jgi:N-acetylmuramoyl-L-alanine amidase